MTDAARAFAGRRVLVTGHTGFKGAWLTLWLRELGAEPERVDEPDRGVPGHDEPVSRDIAAFDRSGD